MLLKLFILTQLSFALSVPDIELQVSLATVGGLVSRGDALGGAGEVGQTGQVDGDDAIGGGQVGGAGQDGGGGQLKEDVTLIRPESTLNRIQHDTKSFMMRRKVFDQTSV